jgi:hypothetical protein
MEEYGMMLAKNMSEESEWFEDEYDEEEDQNI